MSRSKFRTALAWTPVALLVVGFVILLVLFLLGGLFRVFAWQFGQILVPLLGILALFTGVVLWIRARKHSPLVLASIALGTLALVPLLHAAGLAPFRYPASIDATRPHLSIRLPLDGLVRVAWGGDHVRHNYHAAHPDQRWAYDLVVTPYMTQSSTLDDYGCYGQDIIAPMDSLVVKVHDGEPDAIPGEFSSNTAQPLGNHVVLKSPETQTYLILAHLQPGSLSVRDEQEIKEGEVLGRCGNSGNTSEPHVHLHHQREDPNVFPVGFAQGLPLFFRDHQGPEMPQGGLDEASQKPTGDEVRHEGEQSPQQ